MPRVRAARSRAAPPEKTIRTCGPDDEAQTLQIPGGACRKLYIARSFEGCDGGHPGLPARRYSYRNASAGRIREADQLGYSVATKDIPMDTTATTMPSLTRGANGT